jgi:hypothetical protein
MRSYTADLSGSEENLDPHCVAGSRVLVVANEAASLGSGENTMRLEVFSHFSLFIALHEKHTSETRSLEERINKIKL